MYRQVFNALELLQNTSCNILILQLRDGSSSGTVLGTFCGPNLPSALTASGRTVVVQMRTDSSVTAGGFSAAWSGAYYNYSCLVIC